MKGYSWADACEDEDDQPFVIIAPKQKSPTLTLQLINNHVITLNSIHVFQDAYFWKSFRYVTTVESRDEFNRVTADFEFYHGFMPLKNQILFRRDRKATNGVQPKRSSVPLENRKADADYLTKIQEVMSRLSVKPTENKPDEISLQKRDNASTINKNNNCVNPFSILSDNDE